MVTIQWPMHGTDDRHCECDSCRAQNSCCCQICHMKRHEKRMSEFGALIEAHSGDTSQPLFD